MTIGCRKILVKNVLLRIDFVAETKKKKKREELVLVIDN